MGEGHGRCFQEAKGRGMVREGLGGRRGGAGRVGEGRGGKGLL